MELLKICSEKLHLDSKIDEFLLMHFSVLSRNVLLWVFLLTNCSSEPMWWKVTFPDWLSFLILASEKTRKPNLMILFFYLQANKFFFLPWLQYQQRLRTDGNEWTQIYLPQLSPPAKLPSSESIFLMKVIIEAS